MSRYLFHNFEVICYLKSLQKLHMLEAEGKNSPNNYQANDRHNLLQPGADNKGNIQDGKVKFDLKVAICNILISTTGGSLSWRIQAYICPILATAALIYYLSVVYKYTNDVAIVACLAISCIFMATSLLFLSIFTRDEKVQTVLTEMGNGVPSISNMGSFMYNIKTRLGISGTAFALSLVAIIVSLATPSLVTDLIISGVLVVLVIYTSCVIVTKSVFDASEATHWQVKNMGHLYDPENSLPEQTYYSTLNNILIATLEGSTGWKVNAIVGPILSLVALIIFIAMQTASSATNAAVLAFTYFAIAGSLGFLSIFTRDYKKKNDIDQYGQGINRSTYGSDKSI